MDWVMTKQTETNVNRKSAYPILKRMMDVMLCLLAMPFALPLILLCALAVMLDSPGPAFFIQERVGKDGKRFQIYKMRTMQHKLDDTAHRAFMKAFVSGQIGGDAGAEALILDDGKTVFSKAFLNSTAGDAEPADHPRVYKPAIDSQVTHVGRILRKTSLDELPQIFNILKGDMSIVGPRPNVPWEVEAYLPWHHTRLEVLPGMTGLAQVHGRSGINFDTIVKYDIEYVEKQSLLLDIQIIWLTFTTVLSSRGAE